ncbi:MAG TPA: MotE family protein [Mesorhizobium sp.]|nr:MotE family protein [Mesorhizobium sp.]
MPFRRALRIPATLALLLCAAAAQATGTGEPAGVAPAPDAGQSEVERFCGNIADAARDRRHALQKAEIERLQGELDQRLLALEEKRAEYERWLKKRDDFMALAQENVVSIYRTMRPDAAAERLAELPVELAAGILMKLDARKAGVILNEMELKSAAAVTSVMAAAAGRRDPS